MGNLSDELVQRLRARALDPAGRSGDAALAAQSISVGDALAAQRAELAGQPAGIQEGVNEYLQGMSSPFAGMIHNALTGDGRQAGGLLGALSRLTGGKQLYAMTGSGPVSFGSSADPTPAPPPATETAVADAEHRLGFALPGELRRFYLEVADGGVGPGAGVYSLDELLDKHREVTSEPVGPQGQDWPSTLLPISGEDWGLVSLDRTTGRLVYWDLEELDDDDELPPGQPTWAASFVPEADSLQAWLSSWLDD
jgi:hypothetical protein